MSRKILTDDQIIAVSSDEIQKGLEACTYMATELGIDDGSVIRPCIAVYFMEGCKGGLYSLKPNPACHLIAVELCRLGTVDAEAMALLKRWNKRCRISLPERDIGGAVSTAYRNIYKYGCHHANLSYTCMGKDNCPFIRQGIGTYKKKVLWRDFVLKGWQWVVSPTANMIYNIAIPEMEYRRGISPGQTIYVQHRVIAEIIGRKSHSRIGQFFEELDDKRLIVYKPGDPLKKNHKASEIIRIVPIPDIPEIYRMNNDIFN